MADVLVVPSDTPPTSEDDSVCEIPVGLAALKIKIPKNNEVYQKKYGPRLKRENVEMQTPWPKNAVAMPTYEKVQEYMGYVEKITSKRLRVYKKSKDEATYICQSMTKEEFDGRLLRNGGAPQPLHCMFLMHWRKHVDGTLFLILVIIGHYAGELLLTNPQLICRAWFLLGTRRTKFQALSLGPSCQF
jgi:hypothetical protein